MLAPLALMLAIAQSAGTTAVAIHSDPEAGDNVRFYAFLDTPTANLTMSRGPPSEIPGRSVMFMRLEPGHHTAAVALPDGSLAALEFDLKPAEMIESKGRHWWCLSTGRRAGQLVVLQLAPAQCKTISDAGPD